MAETLKHSLRAYILRDLIRHGALYSDQMENTLAPNEQGLFKLALERLIDVKFISRVKGCGSDAYTVTPRGKEAYLAYVSEMVVN